MTSPHDVTLVLVTDRPQLRLPAGPGSPPAVRLHRADVDHLGHGTRRNQPLHRRLYALPGQSTRTITLRCRVVSGNDDVLSFFK